MQIQSIFSKDFQNYGKVIKGLDCTPLLDELSKTPKPENNVIYVPSHNEFEKLEIFNVFQKNIYGNMPIQIGYCNGTNTKLNCLEYHKDNEINIVAQDTIFLVALQSDLQDYKLDTKKVKAFKAPKGSVIELFSTCLHYAPCDAQKNNGFRVCVVLPRNTNTKKPKINLTYDEDKLLFATNKWLIAHEQSNEASNGAFIGLIGDNIDIKDII